MRIALLAFIWLASSCQKQYPKEVITLIGQSNITGMIMGTLPKTEAFIMAYGTESENDFDPLEPGVNTFPGKSMYGLQTELAKLLPGRYFLQAAQSGQAIRMWQKDQAIGKFMYAAVDKLKERGTRFPVAIFCQGETNATNADWDSTYYHNAMEQVIKDFRTSTGDSTKFIIIQFPDCFTNIPADRMKQIRSIQGIIGEQPNNFLIPYEADDKCIDGIHFDGFMFEKKARQIRDVIAR